MPEYRVFPIDSKNRIIGPSTVIVSEDDDGAVEKSQLLADGSDVEVWQATRLIAIIKKPAQKGGILRPSWTTGKAAAKGLTAAPLLPNGSALCFGSLSRSGMANIPSSSGDFE